MKTNRQSGQVGLIVLLLMSAMLSVGIGAVSRSTQDLRITRQELESSQVFNAAEAGIEAGLNDLERGVYTGGQIGDIDGLPVSYTVAQVNTFDMEVVRDAVVNINVAGATNQPLLIDWGRGENSCEAASLMVTVYGGSNARRYGFSGCDKGYNFDVFPGGGGFAGSVSLGLNGGDELVRIRPIDGDTDIVVNSLDGNYPSQMYRVESRASRQDSNETRVVTVQKSLPSAPGIFDYALFSGTTLIK